MATSLRRPAQLSVLLLVVFMSVPLFCQAVRGPGNLPGDANHDGTVNFDDFVILKQNFPMATGATSSHGDFDFDNDVDLDDFVILKANFGVVRLNLGGDVTMRLVRIPAGTFMMGSPSTDPDRLFTEEPRHQVTISQPFHMGVYEVTQRQYLAVMGMNPSYYTSSGLDAPVEQVYWHKAMAFCDSLSQLTGRTVTLPTEAQWEYACRAGSTTRFYYGDDLDYSLLGDYAWYSGNSGSPTHSVGQKTPNAWGLYDMYGNVWEWCAGWYGPYPSADPWWAPTNYYRVLRGGSCDNHARTCRSATRAKYYFGFEHRSVGFRVVVVSGGLD